MTEWRMDAEAVRAVLAAEGDDSPAFTPDQLRALGYETPEGDRAAQRANADARDARLVRLPGAAGEAA
jgi:hypothetical protein